MVNNIEIEPQYNEYNLRNDCGATYWANAKSSDEDYGLGPYSGCGRKRWW